MNASNSQLNTAPSAPTIEVLRIRRPMIVAGATLAPLLVWLVARLGFGLAVRSPTFNGQHFEIGPLLVLLTALVPCLLGWGVVAMLERTTARARVMWIAVALIGLV